MADELKQLLKQKEKLQAEIAEIDSQIEGMKQEKQQELLAQLRELGWTPSGGGGGRGKAKGSRKSSSEATCPICGIAGHDGRAHRSQGKNKKKFTAEELREKGLATA